jgi:HK97 gp10 family phage protein
MAEIAGFKELSQQLARMGAAPGGKALRSAAMSSMLPAVKRARAEAPVGNPPYESRQADGTNRNPDPYPTRTYKGRLKSPGFASRNVARASKISGDKRSVEVSLGVRKEAFYAVQFVELGYGKTPRRPWLEPSFRAALPEVNTRFKEQLKRLIDKGVK